MLVHSLNVGFLVSLEGLKFTLKLQWKKCEQAALCSAVKAWLNNFTSVRECIPGSGKDHCFVIPFLTPQQEQ